ncbi:glycoside hydrolase family 15 protein [Amaricoccus macauensis]|uniref:glycoside hydrolase family 15 protein n=1 Tax=Amaricoccus macauensis TaxID=57001 RepID=UPI003C7E26ED
MADTPESQWLEHRRGAAARALRRAVSATDLEFERPGFGWKVRPAPGSILASPRGAHWDPDPDYFHHWVRDGAIVLAAIPEAMAADPEAGGFWRQAIADHIRFSLAISDPARKGPAVNPLKETTQPSHLRFLRRDEELRALEGSLWLAETRFGPDGRPDLEQWARPQDDGPALRAAALIRITEALPEMAGPEADALIERDLAHTVSVAGRLCFGPWEEAPMRRTTFTLISQWDALTRGMEWGRARTLDRAALRQAADRVADLVSRAADPETGGWRESLEAPAGELDAATVLAILHAGRTSGPFALNAPRTLATAAALEALFARLYPLNHTRAVPAVGRFERDVFFGGNPWYPVTLGFAELHYRIAMETADRKAFEKADRWMALIESVSPEGDDLPEQIHRETGAPASCRALSWSSAAFLGAEAARRAALQAMG